MARHPVTSKPHIRVETPVTLDGLTPEIGPDNKVRYNTVFLPLSAKNDLARQNQKLQSRLKMIITELPGDGEKATAKPKPSSNTGTGTGGRNATGTGAGASNTGTANDGGASGGEQLSDLTKDQLSERYEQTFGVAPKPKWTKPQLIEAIENNEPIEPAE